MTDIVKASLSIEEADERARRAVQEFMRSSQAFSSVAQALTGNPKMRVRPGEMSRTDGQNMIEIRPDIRMADRLRHTPGICGNRNEDGDLLCTACYVREDTWSVVMHEISHQVENSFAVVPLHEMQDLMAKLPEKTQRAIRNMARTLEAHGMEPNWIHLSECISKVLPGFFNLCEDARVNHRLAEVRPGAGEWVRRHHQRIYDKGVELPDGRNPKLNELDPNIQAMLAFYAVAMGLRINPADYDESVQVMLADPDTGKVAGVVATAPDVHAEFHATVQALDHLRKHGFLLEPPEPPAEPGKGSNEPDDTNPEDQDEDEADGNQGSGEEDSGSSDGAGSPDEEGEGDDADGDDSGQQADGDPGDSESEDDDGSGEDGDGSDGEGRDGGGNKGADGGNDSSRTDGESDGSLGTAEYADGDRHGSNGLTLEETAELARLLEELIGPITGHENDMRPAVDPGDDDHSMGYGVCQVAAFDMSSREVLGVRIHEYGTVHPQWVDAGPLPWDRAHGHTRMLEYSQADLTRAFSHMRSAFDENAKQRMETSLRSGPRLNGRVLGRRLAVGDDRVMQKRHLPQKRNWRVIIGGDISGSTASYPRIDLIKAAMMAQGDLCSMMRIDFEMYCHTAFFGKVPFADESYDYAYFLDLMQIRGPHEPWDDKAKERLISITSGSDNLDGHTLEFYRKRAQAVPASDTLILYYTDGAIPAANYTEEKEIFERELELIRRTPHMHCVGVGVMTDSPKRYGMDTIQIDGPEDIYKVVEGLEQRIKFDRSK